MLQRWRTVGNTVSDLTSQRFEPQTFRSKDERVTARPTGRLLLKLTVLNRNDFRYYLTHAVHLSMHLRSNSSFEVLCVVKQLNLIKSCGLDGIDTKFVQLAAEKIAPALCLIFNACFQYGFFLTGSKEAKFVPAFKSGDRRKLTNIDPYRYCPVSR